MIIQVRIQKVNDADTKKHRYYVTCSDYPKVEPFYFEIDPEKESIRIMDQQNQNLKMIDLTNPDEIINVKEIPTRIMAAILSKTLEALAKNSFPEDMSYYA